MQCMNAYVFSLERLEKDSFLLKVIPVEAGLIQVTLSKMLQSTDGQFLKMPPSISFKYYGVSIIASDISKVDQTQARVSTARCVHF